MGIETMVEFDFDDVVATVGRFDSRANRDDAEEAVQQGVERLLRRGEPLYAAYVVNKARSCLSNAMKRREQGNLSLDAFLEEEVDEAPVELAVEEVDFDAHVALGDVERHPVLSIRKAALEAGAAPVVAPRGSASPNGRYTDDEIAEVRRLRATGAKFAEIETQTGVERSYAAAICRGKHRVLPTADGWTDERMIETVRIFARDEGRPPTYQEGHRRPDLPNPSTLTNKGKTWRWLLREAGCPSPYEGQRQWRKPWTYDEARAILRDFFERHGRMPHSRELRSPLPAGNTIHRLFGTRRSEVLKAMVLGRSTR
jgi:hypothetical protein